MTRHLDSCNSIHRVPVTHDPTRADTYCMIASLILTAVLATAPTPAFLPVIGADGYTCPGGTLADGTVRPGDGFSPAGMTCLRVSVAMVEADLA